MKFHPIQGDGEALKKLAAAFKHAMEKRGLLPKNPWRAKRLEAWLEGMGAKMDPGSMNVRNYERPDTNNFVNFLVHCPQPTVKKGRLPPRIKGRRESRFVRIQIPWELADKVLVLGYLP